MAHGITLALRAIHPVEEYVSSRTYGRFHCYELDGGPRTYRAARRNDRRSITAKNKKALGIRKPVHPKNPNLH